ncbi:McrC family protein [Psychrobacter cryohalolentis]|uniref:McrC family protein n=1 Tax=Psychrobacter cryohalolentis TaxID=330922 RepID=UPI003F86409C
MINTHKHTQSSAMNIMTVFEHQRLIASNFLYDSDFQWLITQELSVFSIKRKQGQWQLKVGHYIGVIVLPSGMTLEILPKFIANTASNSIKQPYQSNESPVDTDILQTRHWVQNMLSDLMNSNDNKSPHSKNFGQFSNQLTILPVTALPLSDWLITQFLQRLTNYQPTKQYQTQIHNQATLQGRLLIKEQLRHNSMQPHKFVCERSVLNQDMLGNRVIKSALTLLMPLLPQSNLLLHLQPWQQVSVLHQHEIRQLESIYLQAKRELAIQPLQVKQLQAALQLVDFAYWLLSQSNTETGQSIGSTKSLNNTFTPPRLCLLIDMNQAFEQWASQRIALSFQQLSDDYKPLFQAQRVWLNDAEGQACLSIRPDLLIYRQVRSNAGSKEKHDDALPIKNLGANPSPEKQSGQYSHVIDIKWKPLAHASAINASDAYQLSSYAQAYQAEQVWLVYPVQDNQRRAVVLKQDTQDIYNSENPSYAQLWLIPFNVLTGTINADLLPT